MDRRFHPWRWTMLRDEHAAPSRRSFLNTSIGECIQVDIPELLDHELFAVTADGLLVLLHGPEGAHIRLLNLPAARQLFRAPGIMFIFMISILSTTFLTRFPCYTFKVFSLFVTRENDKKKDDEGGDYFPPPEGMFAEEGEDEKEEDRDMGYSGTSDEERPDVKYNRDDPSSKEGTIFSSALDCINALATFLMKTQSEFVIDKSDSTRLTVHCAYKRCQWRMHASLVRDITLFQVKVNKTTHTCPSVNRRKRLRANNSVMWWILGSNCLLHCNTRPLVDLGRQELGQNLREKDLEEGERNVAGVEGLAIVALSARNPLTQLLGKKSTADENATHDHLDAENDTEVETDVENATEVQPDAENATKVEYDATIATYAPTVSSAISPRKNYKKVADRGMSSAKKSLKCAPDPTIKSLTGSNQLRQEVSKNVTTRRSSRLLTNPACKTRSKKMIDM
ncbi:hypothetical protein D1007_05084 [Hordeum vulgare]|nr:hypothetical protein D1007_05084 [Hordeum vulgare]